MSRFVFAQEYIHWTPKEWKRVIFSDESKFNLEHITLKNITPTVKHGGFVIAFLGVEMRTDLFSV